MKSSISAELSERHIVKWVINFTPVALQKKWNPLKYNKKIKTVSKTDSRKFIFTWSFVRNSINLCENYLNLTSVEWWEKISFFGNFFDFTSLVLQTSLFCDGYHSMWWHCLFPWSVSSRWWRLGGVWRPIVAASGLTDPWDCPVRRPSAFLLYI